MLGQKTASLLRTPSFRAQQSPDTCWAVLQQASQRGYEIAVARLKQVRDVMTRLGKTRELAAYLAAVRLAHKRKRNFLKLLDGAKLG